MSEDRAAIWKSSGGLWIGLITQFVALCMFLATLRSDVTYMRRDIEMLRTDLKAQSATRREDLDRDLRAVYDTIARLSDRMDRIEATVIRRTP